MSGALFDFAEFNQAEFNEEIAVDHFTLYLNPDTTMVLVGSGDGLIIPPAMLYPGSEYLIRLTSAISGVVELRFTTPPSINYDGMGG